MVLIVYYMSLLKSIVLLNVFVYSSPLPSQLQSILQANEKRITDLKQMSLQLDQVCKEPCKDTVEIQTVTGKGKISRYKRSNDRVNLLYIRLES